MTNLFSKNFRILQTIFSFLQQFIISYHNQTSFFPASIHWTILLIKALLLILIFVSYNIIFFIDFAFPSPNFITSLYYLPIFYANLSVTFINFFANKVLLIFFDIEVNLLAF